MDTSLLGTLDQIAPDLMEEMELRALVLERVAALGPIGRRALATRLHLAEREVRSSADALKTAGCLTQNASGMELTERGRALVDAARVISRGRRTLAKMEMALSRQLNVERVCVVHGDADRDASVVAEIGRAAARQIRFLMQEAQVLAVSGGRTVAAAAEAIAMAAPMEVTIVPAGGGSSGEVRTQANTVAETMAQRLGGRHRLLHIPDGITGSAAVGLSHLPQVREVLELLRSADVLLYGIGRATDLAERRGMGPAEREALFAQGVVAEALGFYFDAQGNVSNAYAALALRAEEIGVRSRAAAVAGGSSKAEAIIAVCRHHAHKLLVVDEGAAQRMIDLLR